MAHDGMHHYGHGTTGARILTTLDTVDGTSPRSSQPSSASIAGPIGRHLAKLVADELVTCTDGLYYRPRHTTEELLDHAAERRGTIGLCAKRAWRHAQERAAATPTSPTSPADPGATSSPTPSFRWRHTTPKPANSFPNTCTSGAAGT
jgi:hypothetical protein